MNWWIKSITVILFIIASFLEFIKIEKKSSWGISWRREIASTISGTIYALIGLIIWLFG
jgi:hypothetical protein